jgi:cytochrome c-type biogenesis protein CcmH
MTLYLIFAALLVALLTVLLSPLRQSALTKRQRYLFAAAISGFFMISSAGLYAMLGSPAIVPLLAARQEKLDSLRHTILAMSARVKANAHDLPAWVELGRSFMETAQYSGAANAFRQAVVLSKGNPVLLLAYAQAMIADANGKVTDDAKKALEMCLLQDRGNDEARYWLAVRQLQDGHMEQAMTAMKSLYHSLPDNSPLKAMIDRQIGRK